MTHITLQRQPHFSNPSFGKIPWKSCLYSISFPSRLSWNCFILAFIPITPQDCSCQGCQALAVLLNPALHSQFSCYWPSSSNRPLVSRMPHCPGFPSTSQGIPLSLLCSFLFISPSTKCWSALKVLRPLLCFPHKWIRLFQWFQMPITPKCVSPVSKLFSLSEQLYSQLFTWHFYSWNFTHLKLNS